MAITPSVLVQIKAGRGSTGTQGEPGTVDANSGLVLGSGDDSYTITYNAPGIDIQPGQRTRSEIRLIPRQAGGAWDQFSGGELTLFGTDPVRTGSGNLSYAVMYARLVSGEPVDFFITTRKTGTGVQMPIRIDAVGGGTNHIYNIDGSQTAQYTFQILNLDGVQPALKIGPCSIPQMEMDDNTPSTGRRYAVRSNAGKMEFVDLTAVAVRAYFDNNGIFESSNGIRVVRSGGVANIALTSTSSGQESSASFNIKDVGGTNNNYKFAGGVFADGQFGLYDVTGAGWVVEFRRNTLGAAGGKIIFYHPVVHPSFTVALLPAGMPAGSTVFATNARNSGEGAGVGTGSLVTFDGTNWKIPGVVGAVTA